MTGSSTTASSDPDAGRYPEPPGEHEDADVRRHVAPDADDVETDEAGYGYGV